MSKDTSNPRPKNVQTGQRKGPPLLVPPTPYPQLYFWSGRPCIAPTSMTSAISKRLLPSALICSGSMGFCDGMFMGFYWISWDFRWNLRDFMGCRLWISWHFMGFSWILHSSLRKKNMLLSPVMLKRLDQSQRKKLSGSPGVKLPGVPPWQPVDRFSSSLDHQHFRWCCDMARHGSTWRRAGLSLVVSSSAYQVH